MFRSKIVKARTKVNLRISTTLKEKVIKSQWMFEVRFIIEDWEREVATWNELEPKQVFHDIYHAEDAIAS